MKKTNKKGFTIVELVIVIAVIAILAGVLIPTFAGVVSKAKTSSAIQSARNAYTELLAEENGTLTVQNYALSSTITADTGATAINVTAVDATTKAVTTMTITGSVGGSNYTVTYSSGTWTATIS